MTAPPASGPATPRPSGSPTAYCPSLNKKKCSKSPICVRAVSGGEDVCVAGTYAPTGEFRYGGEVETRPRPPSLGPLTVPAPRLTNSSFLLFSPCRNAHWAALLGPLAGSRPDLEDGHADLKPDNVLLRPDEEALHQEQGLPLHHDL